MSLYASIDESYSVHRLNSINAVVKACEGYYTRDGQTITKSVAQKKLKDDGFLNVYSYNEEELADAQEDGSVIGIDWTYKIQPF